MDKSLLKAQINILEQALKKIQDGSQTFICAAITSANGSKEIRDTLRSRTMDRIEPFFTIDSWRGSSPKRRKFSAKQIRIHWLKTSIARGKAKLAKL